MAASGDYRAVPSPGKSHDHNANLAACLNCHKTLASDDL